MRECLRHVGVRFVAGDMANGDCCGMFVCGSGRGTGLTSLVPPPSVGGHGDTIKDDRSLYIE